MKKLIMSLFPDYSRWEVLEVYSDRNSYYCLQVRVNKSNGLKQFRSTLALDSFYAVQLKNFSINKINDLTLSTESYT